MIIKLGRVREFEFFFFSTAIDDKNGPSEEIGVSFLCLLVSVFSKLRNKLSQRSLHYLKKLVSIQDLVLQGINAYDFHSLCSIEQYINQQHNYALKMEGNLPNGF